MGMRAVRRCGRHLRRSSNARVLRGRAIGNRCAGLSAGVGACEPGAGAPGNGKKPGCTDTVATSDIQPTKAGSKLSNRAHRVVGDLPVDDERSSEDVRRPRFCAEPHAKSGRRPSLFLEQCVANDILIVHAPAA
eukprot:scaffold4673_cov26-Tisochrysis_lutea.AAC.2